MMVNKGVVRILPSLSRNSTATVSNRVPFTRKVTRKKKKSLYLLKLMCTGVEGPRVHLHQGHEVRGGL